MAKAVIFVMENVLVDTAKTIDNIFAKLLTKELGELVSKDDFGDQKDVAIEDRLATIAQMKDRELSDEQIFQITNTGMLEYQHNQDHYLELSPGALTLLNQLHKKKIELGAVSSKGKKHLEKLLMQFQIRRYFSIVLGADEVNLADTLPELFLKGVREMHIQPPECVVLENSIEGAEAAQKLGMKVIAVSRIPLPGIHHQVTSLVKIYPEMIENL